MGEEELGADDTGTLYGDSGTHSSAQNHQMLTVSQALSTRSPPYLEKCTPRITAQKHDNTVLAYYRNKNRDLGGDSLCMYTSRNSLFLKFLKRALPTTLISPGSSLSFSWALLDSLQSPPSPHRLRCFKQLLIAGRSAVLQANLP